MTRQHPFFSRIGCLGGGTLILGIVVTVLFSGGAIFSPGALTAWAQKQTPLNGFSSHAEFQNDCTQCHAPFEGTTAERCEACHTAVHTERETAQGLHGHLPADQASKCGHCHEDHAGPEHDPSSRAIKEFDHNVIGFSLNHHLVNFDNSPLSCQGCHTVPDYTFVASRCAECHAAAKADFMRDHEAAFGSDCQACHDGVEKTSGFTHSTTKFPLVGQHATLACAACHKAGQAPQSTPIECAACHLEPVAHKGLFGTDCAACHTPDAWTPAALPDFPAFDHTQTQFQLVNHTRGYDNTPFNCKSCHAVQGAKLTLSTQTCVDCHGAHDTTFMTKHVQDYGTACVSCHDGAGNMKDFDHNKVFALDGQHAGLECAACHKPTEAGGAPQFRGTPRECAACHQEPKVHAGLFGVTCQACHTTSAWAPAHLTQHTFPLDHGGQGEIPCATCHTATYTQYTCYGCHEHDPGETQRQHESQHLAEDRLANCAACHATGRKDESPAGEPSP